jgi:hypothetical protein
MPQELAGGKKRKDRRYENIDLGGFRRGGRGWNHTLRKSVKRSVGNFRGTGSRSHCSAVEQRPARRRISSGRGWSVGTFSTIPGLQDANQVSSSFLAGEYGFIAS